MAEPSAADDASPGPVRQGEGSGDSGSADRATGSVGFGTALAVGLALFLLLGCGAMVALVVSASSGSTELAYTIPAGTGARIDKGEFVEIIPTTLDLKVDDKITVVNNDGRSHVIGPFSVRAGETITYQFSAAGIYKGECTVHSAKEVVITVT